MPWNSRSRRRFEFHRTGIWSQIGCQLPDIRRGQLMAQCQQLPMSGCLPASDRCLWCPEFTQNSAIEPGPYQRRIPSNHSLGSQSKRRACQSSPSPFHSPFGSGSSRGSCGSGQWQQQSHLWQCGGHQRTAFSQSFLPT